MRLMRGAAALMILLTGGLTYFLYVQAGTVPAVENVTIPAVPVEKHQLENGLEILLVEDHRLPRVSVNLWYHVGPVNELPGRTGFAHLFEHMMFQSSKHVPEDSFFRMLEAAGASDMNGTTDFDRTNYFEIVPSHELELALWLESDRMGYLLDNLTADAFRNQQDVVRNERRQSTENTPYGIVEEAIYHNLFPKDHPYYAAVIGSHADIQAAKLEDVRNFFKQYYSPNNASIAIVGDIDKAKTLQLVEKYFGSLKRGPDVPPVQFKTSPITSERRAVVQDRVELPRIYMTWLTPEIYKPGDAEAGLAASILGQGKSSRLYKSLVYDKQIAQDVTIWYFPYTLGSTFIIQATARPGHTLEEIEKEIDAQLEAFRTRGPEAKELARAKAQIETATFFSLERNGGFSGVADRINMYNHHLKNPDYLAEDILRYRRASPAGVRDFAARYLVNSARVVIHGVPGEPSFGTAVPTPEKTVENAQPESVNADEPWRGNKPAAGTPPGLVIPTPVSFQMENGLTVILDQRKGIPVFAANLIFRSGSGANPVDKPGLAGFTLDMLDEGTSTRSATEFADELEQAGARLRVSATLDYSSLTLSAMKDHMRVGMELLADAVVHPSFPKTELERTRQIRLATLTQINNDSAAVANRVMVMALNGATSPLGYVELGTEASLRAFSRDDLQAFWARNMVPNNAALIVSGDLDPDELRLLLDRVFQNWKPGTLETAAVSPLQSTGSKIVLVDKPGAPQTQLRVALRGPARTTPDYEPLQLMNAILGGMFSSRININLREEKGYTYGASSAFTYLKNGGWFAASSGVRTDVTAPAVREVIREIQRITETQVSRDELTMAKERLVGALPARFETTEQTVAVLSDVYVYDLGLGYYSAYADKVSSVEAPAVHEVASKYLPADKLLVVTVGDRVKIEEELRKLNVGEIEVRDSQGVVLER